jgi:hypothetical protein
MLALHINHPFPQSKHLPPAETACVLLQMMEEQARVAYSNAGYSVINIAVWNMHLNESHQFEGILESGIKAMGNGGGFRIVCFTGAGSITNEGDRGTGNWLCSGRQEQNDNVITFSPVA